MGELGLSLLTGWSKCCHKLRLLRHVGGGSGSCGV